MTHSATDVSRLQSCITAAKLRHRHTVTAAERSDQQATLRELLSCAHDAPPDEREPLLRRANLVDGAVRQRQACMERLSTEELLTELFIAGIDNSELTAAEPDSAE